MNTVTHTYLNELYQYTDTDLKFTIGIGMLLRNSIVNLDTNGTNFVIHIHHPISRVLDTQMKMEPKPSIFDSQMLIKPSLPC